MGGRVGRTEGTKFQNFINRRKIRHSFAGGAVFEASQKKSPPLFYLKDTNSETQQHESVQHRNSDPANGLESLMAGFLAINNSQIPTTTRNHRPCNQQMPSTARNSSLPSPRKCLSASSGCSCGGRGRDCGIF